MEILLELLDAEEKRILERLDLVRCEMSKLSKAKNLAINQPIISCDVKIDRKFLIEKINSLFNVDITEKNREQKTAFARFIYMKYCRLLTKSAYWTIATPINLTHATVMSGIKKFDKNKKNWPMLGEMENEFLKAMNQPHPTINNNK